MWGGRAGFDGWSNFKFDCSDIVVEHSAHGGQEKDSSQLGSRATWFGALPTSSSALSDDITAAGEVGRGFSDKEELARL